MNLYDVHRESRDAFGRVGKLVITGCRFLGGSQGGYSGLSDRQWAVRPVTRTRRQWAEFLALWYTVHGSTRQERLRFRVACWWLSLTRRLDQPRTIRLDPVAFGVKIKRQPPTINPRPHV